MNNIFFMIVSFACIIFFIEHLTKILAHNNFKDIEKLKRKTRLYVITILLMGIFLYLFLIGNLFELLGNPQGGGLATYVVFIVAFILFFFFLKYSTYAEKKQRERLNQMKDKRL